jgi:hypothetical protein
MFLIVNERLDPCRICFYNKSMIRLTKNEHILIVCSLSRDQIRVTAIVGDFYM